MADTVEEFYSEYFTELQGQTVLNSLQPQVDDVQTLLQDLNSTSKVAEHRLWIFKFSVFSWMQKERFKEHKTEIQEIISQNRFATREWWSDVMKQYQHGYALQFVNNRPHYSVLDEAAQIVKRATCESLGGGQVLLKAAGDGVPLTSAESAGLLAYCRMIQSPGPTVNLVALNADRLRLQAEVFFDPLVFNPDGSLISDPGTFPVKDAVNAYLAKIPFNGVVSLTDLKDEVQKVTGVNDFVIQSAVAVQGSNTYTFNRLFQTVSGWMLEDDTPGQTFDDLLSYTAGS